jgi:dCTP deaminase
MGVLADWQIEAANVVAPFCNAQRDKGIVTFGCSSYGYDLRAGSEFQVFSAVKAGADGVIDPKNFNRDMLEQKSDGKPVIIPPNAFALTTTVEKLSIPRDMLGIVLGKSTYARCGIVVNCTPLEPEWRGHVTIEISNTTPVPAKIYPNEGIAQLLLIRADGLTQVLLDDLLARMVSQNRFCGLSQDEAEKLAKTEIKTLVSKSLCQTSYADKGGRYQDQGPGVVLPCVRGQVPEFADGQPGVAALKS